MRRALFTLVLLSLVLSADAQYSFSCNTIENTENNDGDIPELSNGNCQPQGGAWTIYKDMNLYIPDLDSIFPLHVPPIKTVRLNVNVIQDWDGTGNFQDNETFRNRLRAIINNINAFYSHSTPSDPITWVQELPNNDSRIRFSIGDLGSERVYFYADSVLYNQKSTSLVQNYIHVNYPERLTNLNIYIFGNDDPTNNHASASMCNWINLNANQHVTAYYWVPEADWGISMLWAHEFAHSLGLKHTYDNTICDQSDPEFLRDVFLISMPNVSNCPHICNANANPYEVIGDKITNNIVGGSREERYISPMQAGQVHRATCLTSVRKYISSEKSLVPLIITNNQLWDFDMKLYQDLIIESGATLTLTCRLVMHPEARIIVKQGGSLIVNGATISTDVYEKEMWNGIEVWGYRNENQFSQNGSYRQGYLELINEATIENAICAVQLWRPGMRAYTGGIVHADNAIFRNNSKAVKVMSYVNIDPQTNQEADYNAYFRRCTFEIDHDFLGTSSFNEHVELNGIKGISFAGCEFSTDRNLSDVSPFCNGITAYDAGFEVAHLPITGLRNDTVPRPNYVSSSFTGFYSGIDAATLGINPITFSVSRSIFDNNKFGIMAKNSSFINLVDNAFYIGDDSDCSYGVFTSGVDHFCIEDNRFESVQNTSSETYGIGVHNSSSDNHISNNTFSGLSCANAAIGQNNDGNPIGSYRPQGLLYTCNENNNNSIDFYVQSELNTVSGIRREQGSSALPAANVFSGSQYQFYNGGDYVINYYYSSIIGQAPSPTKIFQVNDIASVNTNACASRNHDLTREDLDGLEQEYLSAYQLFESASQRYSEQLDGGNTSALLSMINGATIEEIRHVKKTLLLLSPFLSEDVLSAVASREDVFNNQDVFDVYSANPDLLKDLRLLRCLEEKKDPMAPEMIDELKRRAHTVTARTELLSQMGQYSHDFTRAAEDVVRYLLKDSLADSSRIRQWLENIHDVTSDRMIVASFIREGNYNEALDLANRIPEHYGLQGRELLDHTDYVRLLELYQALFESGRSIFEMTELEVRMVEEIANAGCGYSQSLAEVLLSRVSDRISDLSCLDLPNTESDRNAASFSGVPSEDGSGPTIEITPNPATTRISIEYSIPSGMEFAELVLSNIMGMIVLNAELHGSQGQKTLDVSGLANGIYYYVFRCGEIVKTGKIVIAK
ncbi:MAG: T9SS type A sorting domain-containing protein [Bacteroidales bacterium]|nr:T9SS type A sorting domain-containing protein [Bacteroidales bacterium]